MIETHCHLDYMKNFSIEDTLHRSAQAGIDKLICISVEASNYSKVLEIANQFGPVYCSQGVHPHHAKEYNQDIRGDLERNALKNPKVVAVGEIGLDFHYDNSPRDVQRNAFIDQINLAIDLELPVIIHSRDCDEMMAEILTSSVCHKLLPSVIHSFTGGIDLAETALRLGHCLGFNGIVTFKNANDLREIVRQTPIDRILLETDSPYLAPVPYRGKENAPFYLGEIVNMIAEIKKISTESLIDITTSNALRIFPRLI